jgi:magnesium transporter
LALLNTDAVLAQIQAALEQEDLQSAIRILEALRPADQADVFEELDEDDQVSLLPQMDPAVSANILENLDEAEAADLVTSLTQDEAVRILDEMDPDEAADLLGDISDAQAESYLAELENPEDVRPLMIHPDESAGGLMTSEFLALRRRMTASEAILAIRQWQPEDESVYYLFVVDGQDHLVGVVSLRKLISCDPSTQLLDIMNPDVISVLAGTDQEEVARLMTHYDLLALPVLDAENRLMGIITVDDVIDVVVDEATEDIQRLGGAQPLTEPYLNTGIFSMASKRIGWLLLLFITGSLTGTVLRHFEGEMAKVVALSFFIPLLIGTGGNAGSQTTSTIIRALALDELDYHDLLRTVWHELRVGFLLGLGMAIAAYIRAITWGYSTGLAVTVSLAILAIVLWANSLGAMLPLIVVRLHVDPTVVSGPVMSTLVDATGLFIYFTIAGLILFI